jgi:helix-turn-helix, psq domain
MNPDPLRSEELTAALAALVKKKIQNSTMSINQVARSIGISRQTLHTKLAARGEFTPSQLEAIASLFGTKASTLLKQAETEITATRRSKNRQGGQEK